MYENNKDKQYTCYTYTSIEKNTQYNVGYIKQQQQHIKTTTTKQYQS